MDYVELTSNFFAFTLLSLLAYLCLDRYPNAYLTILHIINFTRFTSFALRFYKQAASTYEMQFRILAAPFLRHHESNSMAPKGDRHLIKQHLLATQVLCAFNYAFAVYTLFRIVLYWTTRYRRPSMMLWLASTQATLQIWSTIIMVQVLCAWDWTDTNQVHGPAGGQTVGDLGGTWNRVESDIFCVCLNLLAWWYFCPVVTVRRQRFGD